MTKEQCREAGATMIAWADGKSIQYRRRDQSKWHDIEPDCIGITLSWDWDEFEYRIKPEPKLRPWTEDEVPLCAQYRTRGETQRFLITRSSDERGREAWMKGCEHSIDGGKTWLPCGVEETK